MSKLLQKLDIVGVLLLVAAVLYYSVNNIFDKWAIGLALLGGASIVAGVIANYKQIMLTLGKRSTKYFTNYVVSVVLVLGLAAGLNFIGQRHSKRFDLTAMGRFTLAPQTAQILSKLSKDLEIKVFFPGGDYPPMKELLTQYRAANRHVRFEFVDPDKRPEVAKQYGATEYRTFQNPFTGSTLKTGTVVILYEGRQEKIEKRDQEIREEDLTNAIIKVQRTESKTVYFIQGHGEKDPTSTERDGYSFVKKALEDQGYKVQTVNLAAEGKIPADAKVLVEAGPKSEPFPQELAFLNDFLNKGGGFLVLLSPAPAPSLDSLLKGWGVQADNDIILDVSGIGRLMGAGPAVSLVTGYETHRITDRFRETTFFPLARSVAAAKDSVAGVTVETLFKSNQNSWGKTDLKSIQSGGEVKVGEKTDLKGPLSLAVAVAKEVKASSDTSPALKARMVAVGNSDFAINANFGAGGNGNLFLNMVSWLAQDEDLISIRPKAPEDRKVIMSQSQQTTLQILVLALLPGAVLVAGIIVWTRRRK
ncbi:MAG: GldG family protein [Acidobacteriia bacterium]|nr:GldG family protein [Terriglobia bacterium]